MMLVLFAVGCGAFLWAYAVAIGRSRYETVTMAGVCRPGDVLGIIDGDFAVIGDDLVEVAGTVLDRMLGSGGELVTLVTGADADQELAAAVADRLRAGRPEVDTVVYDGGQPRYPLLIGVE